MCCTAHFTPAVTFAQANESAGADKTAEKQPLFDWSLLWSGSWEDSRTLYNRGELKLHLLPQALTLRGQALDRHPLNLEFDPPWSESGRQVTNYQGGLYHKPTGSRLLYGVLDEWGLSARIRNPWIRSAPFAENHKPLMADLKTAVSVTKEDEAYLYLSTPVMTLPKNVKLRAFASAQTEVESGKPQLGMPVFTGGLDTRLTKDTGLLLETFYTGGMLAPTKVSSWFSDPPPLPEREFNLYAVGLLFNSPFASVSSDWAYSETFAWGADIYGSAGICITPPVSSISGRGSRPLSVSLAADSGGEKVVYRDGAGHGAGFRCAGKIEWKGRQNSLFRVNTTLRGTEIGEEFNRSSSGIYYRLPAPGKSTIKGRGADEARGAKNFPVRLTRISLSADRNAVNPQKISDSFSGSLGLSIPLPKAVKTAPIGVNLAASVKGLNSFDETSLNSPYPVSWEKWNFDSAGGNCELTWSPRNLQFRVKLGYTEFEKKEEIWDFSVYAAAKFKHGRLSLKAKSPYYPEKWLYTISWRLETK